MVTDHHAKAFQLLLMEERHEHENIRQVHAALIGVVDDDRIAFGQVVAIARQHRGHGLGNGPQMQGDGLGLYHHAAMPVADGGRVVHHILDDLRARGAQHGVGHLIGNGVHGVFHHGKADRVEPGFQARPGF